MNTDEKSIAIQFMESHEHNVRELKLVTEERESFKGIAIEAQQLNQLQQAEIERLNDVIRREGARANMWLAHTMKLAGQLEAIQAVISESRKIAKEAAAEIAVRNMDEDMSEEDTAAMQKIAGTSSMTTVLPANALS